MEGRDKTESSFNLDTSLVSNVEAKEEPSYHQILDLRKSMVEQLINEALNVEWTLEKFVETFNFLVIIGPNLASSLRTDAQRKAYLWRVKWLNRVWSNVDEGIRDIKQAEYSEFHYFMNLLDEIIFPICGYFELVGPNVIPYRNMAQRLIKRLKKTRDESVPMLAKEFVEEYSRKRGYKAEAVKSVVYAVVKFYYYFYTYLLPRERRKA